MVTPNFENIAEVNLAGEGFVESKVLAKKFTAMYLVCKELLSKQMHYDWGLRAMSVRGPYPALLLGLLSLPSNHRTTLSPLPSPHPSRRGAHASHPPPPSSSAPLSRLNIISLGRACCASPAA